MKKLLLAVMAMLLFACSGSDDSPVTTTPEENNPENPQPENPDPGVCDNIYVGSVILKSQVEVDAFAAKKYCMIHGSISVGEFGGYNNEINDLSGLSSLREIVGTLSINNAPDLKNLHGLENLEVTTSILIYNTGLETLEHLKSLRTGGYYANSQISIYYNHNLVNLKGLDKIENIGELMIGLNDKLANLEGLNNMKQVNTLIVSNNHALLSFEGLNSIKSVKKLYIRDNRSLQSVQQLENLEAITDFSCESNTMLTVLPLFKNLTKIETVTLLKASLANFEAFANVTEMKELIIQYDYAVTSLKGLEKLKKINVISLDCANLTSVTALNALTSIGGMEEYPLNTEGIHISGERLTSLSGLGNVTAFKGRIRLINNKLLTNYCDISNIVSEASSYEVTGNAYNPTADDIIAGNCGQ